ncbi:hypothetical protein [Streptomyces sp. NPDC051173]|uniref:hypothetical protein n=1 Tax=Streptomyces sp. NPDC051173 TaxID=3155164 RepID=UPI00344B88CD
MTTTTDDLALDEDLHEDLDDGDAGADETGSAPLPARPSTPTPHTPGGIPGVPLTVIGANSTVAAVSAAVVTAGATTTGLAAAGLAVTAVGATALTRRVAAKTAEGRASTTGGGKSAGGSARTRTGSSSGGLGGRRGAAGGGKVPRARGGSASGSRSTGAGGRGGARALRASGQSAQRRAAASSAAKNARGTLGAVKDARAARKSAAPTRAQQRAKDTADARRLSDARRAAKAQRKAGRRAAKGKGTGGGSGSGRTGGLGLRKSPKPTGLGGGRGAQSKDQGRGRRGAAARRDGARKLSMRERARQARRRARDRFRRAQDQRTARRLSRLRDVRRRARARMRMWRRLTASALRCYGRKVLAAGLSIPFFAIGLITHPIGVRFGWRWLQYLGPRVYRRLANAADRARAERDRTIRDAYETAVEAAEHDDHAVAAKVRRAPRHHAHGMSTGGSTHMSTPAGPGFLFNESAADMEAAAQAYDPDGMMHVHDTIAGFPDALDSVANTFAILAKKADDEFPLEPEVGAALDDIYKALQQAIDAAEEAFKIFGVVHEQDIKRHTDPRNNAEEKWDTTNN